MVRSSRARFALCSILSHAWLLFACMYHNMKGLLTQREATRRCRWRRTLQPMTLRRLHQRDGWAQTCWTWRTVCETQRVRSDVTAVQTRRKTGGCTAVQPYDEYGCAVCGCIIYFELVVADNCTRMSEEYGHLMALVCSCFTLESIFL